MAKKFIDKIWEPLEENSGPPVEIDRSPRRRAFMEFDSFYVFEVPGLLPRSKALRKLARGDDDGR